MRGEAKMAAAVTVRKAILDQDDTNGDLDKVCSLVARFAMEKYTLTADTDRLRQFLPTFDSGFTLVAEVDSPASEESGGNGTGGSIVCGYAMCVLTMNSFKGGLSMELHDIFVAQDWRGKKVGQMLMDAVIAEAKERGCLGLSLSTHELNVGARIFYEKNGFHCFNGFNVQDSEIKGRNLNYRKPLS